MKHRPKDGVLYGYGFEFDRDGGCDFFSCNHTIHPSVGWAVIGSPVLAANHRTLPGSNDLVHAPYVNCDDGATVSSDQAHLGPIGDYDLDGVNDVLDFWLWTRTHLRVLPGREFSRTTIDPFPSFPACNPKRVGTLHGVVADITGDGQPDITHCQVSNDDIKLYRRVGNNAFIAGVSLNNRPSEGTCESPMGVFDLDGDGTMNLARNRGGHSRTAGTPPPRRGRKAGFHFPTAIEVAAKQYLDLNGDGLKDLIAIETETTTESGFPNFEFQTTESVRVRLNTGRGFIEGPRGTAPMSTAQLIRAVVADINHDGKEELLVPIVTVVPQGPTQPPNEWRAVGLGNTGLVQLFRFDTHVPLEDAGTFSRSTRHAAVMADVVGDVADDFVMIGPPEEKQVFVLPGRGGSANLLRTVTDAMGKLITVNYSAEVHTPGSDCFPARCDTRAGPLVSNHSVAQVVPGATPRLERNFNYLYTDGRTDPADKKFLGFAKRTVVESRGNAANILRTTEIELDNSTKFDDVYPLAGRRTRVRVVEPRAESSLASGLSSSRVTDTFFNWEPSLFAVSGVVPRLDSREVLSLELLASGEERLIQRVAEDFETDQFGNITKTTRTEFAPTGLLATTIVDTLYRPNIPEHFEPWLISLAERRTVSDRVVFTSPVRAETRRTDFTYYPGTNLLHHVIREPNESAFRLDTELIRNAHGNVEEIVETTAGPELPRRSSVAYGADGVFPETFTNTKGQVSYVAFDPRFGSPTLASDPNGIASQWAYDSFGRVTRQVSPATESETSYTTDFPRTSEILTAHSVMAITTETAGHGRREVGIDAFGRPVRQVATGLLGEDVLTETLYDDAGRVSRQSRPHAPGVTSQGFVQYDYDLANRLAKITQADETTIEFAYASRAIVNNVAPELGALPENYLWFTRTKDPNGNLSLSIADQRGQLAASRDTGGAWVRRHQAPSGPSRTSPRPVRRTLTSTIGMDASPDPSTPIGAKSATRTPTTTSSSSTSSAQLRLPPYPTDTTSSVESRQSACPKAARQRTTMTTMAPVRRTRSAASSIRRASTALAASSPTRRPPRPEIAASSRPSPTLWTARR